MVVLVVEVDLLQQVLQLFPTPVYIAHKDKSIPLLREMRLVHVFDLDQTLELRAHIAAVAHSRRLVHGPNLLYVRGVSRPKVCPPAYEEEECDAEAHKKGALDPPRKPVESVLPLGRDQKFVFFAVEAIFLVRHV
jgi:hypothetical protein